jgi:two-component system response regulator NreC
MRVLLADDHRLMRDGLRAILERAGMQVVGEASSGREALTLVERLRPDVLVMDVAMPELNGIDATRQALELVPETRIVGVSMNTDRRHVLAMLNAGASAYVLKTAAAEEVVLAINEVVAGRKYVSPEIVGLLVDELSERSRATRSPGSDPAAAPGAAAALTQREREVLQLLAEGHSSKEIGAKLGVATTTVETHRRQLMDKLGLRSVAELTKYAIREGLTSTE